MKKGNRNIDQFFSGKLKDFKAEPPHGVWDEVIHSLVFSGKLKDFKAEPPHEVWDEVVYSLDQDKRRTRMAVFMRVAAVISLLTALTVTALLVRDASTSQQVAVEQDHTGEAAIQEENLAADETRQAESTEIPANLEQNESIAGPDDNITQEVYLANNSEETNNNDEIQETATLDEEVVTAEWLGYLAGKYIFRIGGEYGDVSDQTIRRTTRKKPIIPDQTNITEDDYLAENLLDEDASSRGKWGVGTNATPLYSYRNLGTADAAPAAYSSQTIAATNSYYDQVESGTMAYAGGVHVNYIPGRRLSFQSGIYYSKMGINVDHNYYINNLASTQDAANLRLKYSQVQNTTGVITTGEVDKGTDVSFVSNESWDRAPESTPFQINELNATIYEGDIIQNFEYLEIPMLVRYRIIDRKLGFNVLGGVSTNFLVGSNAFYTENDTREKIGKTTDLKPINYSSIVGLGLDYAITKNLLINLEPTFRYYINSINTSGLKSHPYSMGIFTGLSYYF